MRAAMFWIESVSFFLFPYSKLLMEIPICDALDELKSIVMEMCNSHTWYVFGQN